MTTIKTTADVHSELATGPTSPFGGYPRYFVAADGQALSFEAVLEHLPQVLEAVAFEGSAGGWKVVACEINWENAELRCVHSNELIPAAYEVSCA